MQKSIKGVLCQGSGHSEKNLFKRGSIISVFTAHLTLSYWVKILCISHGTTPKGLWLYHRVCPEVLGRGILKLFRLLSQSVSLQVYNSGPRASAGYWLKASLWSRSPRTSSCPVGFSVFGLLRWTLRYVMCSWWNTIPHFHVLLTRSKYRLTFQESTHIKV